MAVKKVKTYYEGLTPEEYETAKSATDVITGNLKRTTEDVFTTGEKMIEVKSVLKHGQFGPWIRNEIGITPQHARKYRKVFEIFGDEKEFYIPFGPTYLFHLTSLPNDLIEEVRNQAKSGGLTAEFLQEILDRKDIPQAPEGDGLGGGEEKTDESLKGLIKQIKSLKTLTAKKYKEITVKVNQPIGEDNIKAYKSVCKRLGDELLKVGVYLETSLGDSRKIT
jgi:hypothetical protein